jgi:hypothetical protein
MICSFEQKDAAVVRLFGRARATSLAESPLAQLLLERSAAEPKGAARQVIEVEIDKTMTSCGYGVPVMKFVRERRPVDRGRRYKDGSTARVQVAK